MSEVDNFFVVGSNYLASTGASSRVGDFWLWDPKRGTARILSAHDLHPVALAFSKDEAYLVSGSNDKTLRMWDLRTGKERQRLEGHNREADFLLYDVTTGTASPFINLPQIASLLLTNSVSEDPKLARAFFI
jgi:WD40 repeat protein